MIQYRSVILFAGVLTVLTTGCRYAKPLRSTVIKDDHSYVTWLLTARNTTSKIDYVKFDFFDHKNRKRFFYYVHKDSCQIHKVEQTIVSRRKIAKNAILYHFTPNENAPIPFTFADSLAVREMTRTLDSLQWCRSSAFSNSTGLIKIREGKVRLPH